MTEQQRRHLLELILNPPPGSALEAAKDFGIDLSLLVENLEKTPAERLRELAQAQSFLEELRRATAAKHE
jgi:hypothetical protein